MTTTAPPSIQLVPSPVLDTSSVQHTSVPEHTRYVPGEIVGTILLQTGRIRQMLFCVAAGHGLPWHRATSDVAVTVIEGAGTLLVEGEASVRLEQGLHLFMPSGKPHAVAAEANLTLLATFSDPAAEIHFTGQE